MSERAERRRRERLVGPLPIAALVAVAGACLWALHRDGRIARGDGAAQTPDALQLAYLQAAVEHDPTNVELRLRLARAQLAGGLLDEAERTLAPTLHRPSERRPRAPRRPHGARPRRRVMGLVLLRTGSEPMHPPPPTPHPRRAPWPARDHRRAPRAPSVEQRGRPGVPPRAEVRATPAEAVEALLLAVDIALARWRAAAPGTPARAAAERHAIERLESALGAELGASALARLAEAARELGRLDLAASASERLANLDPALCSSSLAEAARELLASGAPVRAAESYDRAQACERDARQALALGRRALDAYLAADRGAAALQLAERLVERFPRDAGIAREAERIALAQGDGARARRFGARLLALGVEDAAVLGRQVDLAAAAGDRAAALEAALRLLRLKPDDVASHVRVAELATWTGRTALALEGWMWLARRGEPGDAAKKALELARGLGDDRAVLELLERRSEAGALAGPALRELEDAAERAEGPARTEQILRVQVRRDPGARELWERLAAAQERHLDLEGELETRQELARRFGPTARGSIRIAELHWALGRPLCALRELDRSGSSAGAADADTFRLLGELAWGLEVDGVALRAYRKLRDLGQVDALGAERLFVLTRAAGQRDEAIRVGAEGFARTGQPRLLVMAMDEAARAGRWTELRALADRARDSEAALAGLPDYWLLRGRLEEHEGRVGEADASYRRALATDPGSSAARAALIWLHGGARDRGGLAECLESWAALAWNDPVLRPAYAAGLEQLGRPREALAFYERDARSDPGDEGRVSLYAQALERSGDHASAQALRRLLARRSAGDPGAAVEIAAALPRGDRDQGSPPDLTGLAGSERRVARLAGALAAAHFESMGPLSTWRAGAAAESELLGATLRLRVDGSSLRWADASRALAPVGEAVVLLRATFAALGGENAVAAGASLRSRESLPAGGVAHERALGSAARGRLEAFLNEPADESAAMRMEAARTRVGGALTVSGRSVYAQATASFRSWSARGGSAIAAGGLATAELGCRLASGPDLRLRGQGSLQRNSLSSGPGTGAVALAGGPAAVLPQRLAMLGAGIGLYRWDLGPLRLSGDLWVGGMGPPARPSYRAELGIALNPSRGTEVSLTGFAGNDTWSAGGAHGVGMSVTHRFSR